MWLLILSYFFVEGMFWFKFHSLLLLDFFLLAISCETPYLPTFIAAVHQFKMTEWPIRQRGERLTFNCDAYGLFSLSLSVVWQDDTNKSNRMELKGKKRPLTKLP